MNEQAERANPVRLLRPMILWLWWMLASTVGWILGMVAGLFLEGVWKIADEHVA